MSTDTEPAEAERKVSASVTAGDNSKAVSLSQSVSSDGEVKQRASPPTSGMAGSSDASTVTVDRLNRIEEQMRQFMESTARWQQQMMQQQLPPMRGEYSRAATGANGQLFAL